MVTITSRMITVQIPKSEYYNEAKNEFIEIKERKLTMEHSLISVRNWESKWNVPFLGDEDKTDEQMLDYLHCMTINNTNVDISVYRYIPQTEMEKIGDYIRAPMTATKFFNEHMGGIRKSITADLIYYWMITLGIPIEMEKIHLNQLFTLIRLTSQKNSPKKMSKADITKRNAALNAQRKAKYKTRG